MSKLIPKTRYLLQSDDGTVILKEYFYVEHIKDWKYYIAQEKENGKYAILNLNYEEISDFKYLRMNATNSLGKKYKEPKEVISAIAEIEDENKFVLLNGEGKQIDSKLYDFAIFVNCGLNVIIVHNNKFGVVNYKNEIIIPLEYDSIHFNPLVDKYYANVNGSTIIFDVNGNIIT